MKTEVWNGHSIRFVEKDGEWWAVLNDVCNALGNTAECSICHDNVYGYNACKYCPNCGADMRGTSSEK